MFPLFSRFLRVRVNSCHSAIPERKAFFMCATNQNRRNPGLKLHVPHVIGPGPFSVFDFPTVSMLSHERTGTRLQ
jgi:hypothetical protein